MECGWVLIACLVSPPEDQDVRCIMDKLAGFVAEGGAQLERKAVEDYKDNPLFA